MARKEPMIFQSLVMLSNEDIEKERKKIKKQLIEGVVLLPHYIELIKPQEQRWKENIMQEKIHAKMNDILESSDAATLIKLHDFLELAVESYVDLETIVQHVKRAMDKEIEKEAAYFLGKEGE